MADAFADATAGRSGAAEEDERHVQHLGVERARVAEEAALAQLLAVVARHHHGGALVPAEAREARAQMLVEIADVAVVGRDAARVFGQARIRERRAVLVGRVYVHVVQVQEIRMLGEDARAQLLELLRNRGGVERGV